MGAAKGLSFSSSNAEIATYLEGSWNGEFQGKAATLVIDNVDEKTGEVNGTMFVKFKNLAQESVSGTAKDGDKITLELKDNVQNGVLDGIYTIYVDKSAGTMECQYRNSKTGKEVGFTLTKDGSAENVADEADVVETTSKKNSNKKNSNKNENSQKSETSSSSSDASSNTQATETSKPAGHNINIQGSSSSHSINANSGSRHQSSQKHENSNSGGYNIKVNSSSNSGGGFKLEEVN